jgi:hypothetical protein
MADGSGRRTAKKKNIFHPKKYYAGLTYKQKLQRRAEIKKFGAMSWKNPKAYVGFKTDKYGKTKRKSSYTVEWNKLFPNAKSVEEISKITGVPVKYLRTVFNRGMSAWRTGHIPGQNPQSWSYPRLKSLLLCGKTHYTADADQVRLAKKESASARKWFKRCKTSKLTRI